MRAPSADIEPLWPMGNGNSSGNSPAGEIAYIRWYRGVLEARAERNKMRLPSGVHPNTRSAPG